MLYFLTRASKQGFLPLGSEGKRAANMISHVREVGLSQNVVGVALSK